MGRCNQAAAAYSSLSSHFSQELWGLEGWNLVHTWTVGRCIVFIGIKLLLLIHPFISSFFFLSNFQILKYFVTLFSGMWGLEDWNFVHTWTVGRCIVYIGIRLLLLFVPLFLHFSFSNFQTLNFFQTFCCTFLRNCEACKVETWYTRRQWVDVIRLLLLILPFISSFFFLSNFQILKYFVTLFSGMWGLEDWNFVHTWTVGRCIVYIGIRLLLLFVPLFLHFSFSNFQT